MLLQATWYGTVYSAVIALGTQPQRRVEHGISPWQLERLSGALAEAADGRPDVFDNNARYVAQAAHIAWMSDAFCNHPDAAPILDAFRNKSPNAEWPRLAVGDWFRTDYGRYTIDRFRQDILQELPPAITAEQAAVVTLLLDKKVDEIVQRGPVALPVLEATLASNMQYERTDFYEGLFYWSAALALGAIDVEPATNPHIAEMIAKLVQDFLDMGRSAEVLHLGEYAMPAILAGLESEKESIRSAASYALGHIER